MTLLCRGFVPGFNTQDPPISLSYNTDTPSTVVALLTGSVMTPMSTQLEQMGSQKLEDGTGKELASSHSEVWWPSRTMGCMPVVKLCWLWNVQELPVTSPRPARAA